MNLDDAVRKLREGKEPFSPADLATIRKVVEAIGNPSSFFVAGSAWAADFDEQIHIHPTMIVAKTQIPGAIWANTYSTFPWRVELVGWRNRTDPRHHDRIGVGLCQECFNPLDERHKDGHY